MLLKPRKFFYKNFQKKRTFYKIKIISKLLYGQYGLKILQPLRLHNKQIFRYKIFLKKSVRKADKTNRKLWINIFPHIPLTRKISGSRMGKGKGKLSNWATNLDAGIILFELQNTRSGRAYYFFKQISYRMPIKTRIILKFNKKTTLINSSRTKITEELFW